MEAAPADPYHPMRLGDYIFPLGIIGIIFLVVAIVLTAWLWILMVRSRPLSDYVAYLAATSFSSFLGLFGGAIRAITVFRTLGNNGMATPEPAMLAGNIGEILQMLIGGFGLTCFFLPLGVLVLVIRKPK
jgi:hypothetical protein